MGRGEPLKLLDGETIVTERDTIPQTSFYYFVFHIEPQIIKTSLALIKGTTGPFPPWVGSDGGYWGVAGHLPLSGERVPYKNRSIGGFQKSHQLASHQHPFRAEAWEPSGFWDLTPVEGDLPWTPKSCPQGLLCRTAAAGRGL